MIIRTSHKLLATAATAALLTSPAIAQDSDENYLDEVVTTGTVQSRSQLNTAVSVATVDEDVIEQFNPSSEADLFRLIPGIQVPGGGGPGGNANIAVRGLPVVTGGSPYVAIQEDGLPYGLMGDDAFANNDLWTRYDFTVDKIDAIRGGTAGTFTSQAPGAIINYISRTGEEEGGAVKLTTGIGFNEKQVDFRYGGPITDDLRFHLGGYYRNGEGHKDAGYNLIDSLQIKGNITKEFDNGYFRINGKFADTQEPIYHNSPFLADQDADGRLSNYEPHPFFDPRDETNHTVNAASHQLLDATGGLGRRDINGVSTKTNAIGAEFKFDVSDNFTVENKGRFAKLSNTFANTWGNYGYGVVGGALTVNGVTAPGGAGINNVTNDNGTPDDTSDDFPELGTTVRFASGDNAGDLLPVGTLTQGSANVHVVTPDYGSFVNDLSVTGKFDTGAGLLSARAGYFYMQQSIEQQWHSTNQLRTVDGSNAELVNQFDAAGNQLSVAGQTGYNTGWGAGNGRDYDLDVTNSAPYVALDLDGDRFTLDGSLRFDNVKTQGSYAGGSDEAALNVVDPLTGNTVAQGQVSIGTGLRQTINHETSSTSWTVGGLFRATDDVSLFARAAKGHRHNGYRRVGNAVEFNGDGSLTEFGEVAHVDPVEQYEVGVKGRGSMGFADYTAELTLLNAKFLQNAVGLGAECPDFPATPSCNLPTNVKSNGAEFFSTVDAGDFGLVMNATYTKAKQNGERAVRLPNLTYMVQANYDVMDTLRLNVGAAGQSSSIRGGLIDEGSVQFNAGVAYQPFDGVTFGLDAYNLTNDLAFRGNDVESSGITVNGRNQYTGIPVDGRTLRASVRYDF